MNPLIHLFFPLVEAANTTRTVDIEIPAPEGASIWEIVGTPTFTPDSNGAVATDGTNYITLAVKKGSTTLYSLTTNTSGGAALVANTKTTLTDAAAAPTSKEFTAGTHPVRIDLTKAGTGAACKGVISIGLRRKQAATY